jgi:anti-sigma-K factor RskA
MLAAQALGALDAAEARELEEHLLTCAECRAEAAEWNDTAAALAYTSPMVEPPAELRSRILASARAEGAQGSVSQTIKGDGAKVEGGAAQSHKDESKVVPLVRPARRARRSTASTITALAASLAFVALIISLVVLWNRYNAMRQEVAQLSTRLSEAQTEMARERASLAREREVMELIAARDAQISMLSGTELAKSARAKFVFDRTSGRAMLMAYDLPPAPEGKAYQLWFIAEGKPPMPGRVFTTDATGHAEMHEQVPAEGRGATIFAVTLEPAGGTNAPTSKPYLLSAAS